MFCLIFRSGRCIIYYIFNIFLANNLADTRIDDINLLDEGEDEGEEGEGEGEGAGTIDGLL